MIAKRPNDFGLFDGTPEFYFYSKSRALTKLTSNIAYSGGGSSPSQPTNTTVTQSNVPEWAKPYAMRALGQAEALTDISKNPYQTYDQQRIAEFNPMQTGAYNEVANMRPSSQLNQATGMAGLAGLDAAKAGRYTAAQGGNQYMGPQYQGMGVGYNQLYNEQFSPQAAQQYMSPYMQSVVDQQKQSAIQDYARQLPGAQSAAFKSGAGRGTRSALLQAEGNRNLQNQLGTIQTQGLQQAYQQGMGQFNTDQTQRMQAAQANQNAQLQAQQQGLSQNQFMNQFGQQNAATAAQYGLAGQDLGERSRQFAANQRMEGIRQQLAASGQLGQLGQTDFGQRMGINTARQQVGDRIQGTRQAQLSQAYEDFQNAQRHPYSQISFMSDILRGTPATSSVQTMYERPQSPLGAIAGAGALYMANKGG